MIDDDDDLEDNSTDDGSDAMGCFGFFLLPLLAGPCLAVYGTWQLLDHSNWHDLFKILACIAEVVLMGWVIVKLFRYLPNWLCGIMSAIYVTATYCGIILGIFFRDAKQLDMIWTSALVIVCLVSGYFLGHYAGKGSKPACQIGDAENAR